MSDLLTGDNQSAPGDETTQDVETVAEDEAVKPEVEGEVTPPEEDTSAKDEDVKQEDKEAEGAPEAYEDFALPEGMALDEGALEVGVPLLKELGLSQEKAQKVIDTYTKIETERAKKMHAMVEERNTQWEKAIETDKEVGGEKLPAAMSKVNKIFNTFDTDKSVAKYLADTGQAGCAPLFKMLAKMADHFEEDTFVTGHEKGTGADVPRHEKMGYKTIEDYKNK